MITKNKLLQSLKIPHGTHQDFPIPSFVIDSRSATQGAVFYAIEGERTDGHKYVENAFANCAAIAIISKELENQSIPVLDTRKTDGRGNMIIPETPFCMLVDDSLRTLQKTAAFWREQLPIRVIGVTGSVGKSSTKELVSEVLSLKYHTFKNPGNYNNEIGLPLTILNMAQGYERLVLEMGFYYPGEISFLCEIAKPVIGVVTNVGTVHAERAGSQQTIAEGKAELVAALPQSPTGTAILNFDDPLVRSMHTKTHANVIFYGLDHEADVWANEICSQGLKGLRFRLHHRDKSTTVEVPLLGRHSVQTVLRAVAVGIADGLTLHQITEGLAYSNSQLRLVAVHTRSGALVLDDTYNATPESTIAALDLLSELSGQKIAVLGDMLELGQYEKIGHEQVGHRAAKTVNHLVTVGTKSRTIAAAAKRNGLPATAITSVETAIDAAKILKYNLKSGDVVLIKGSHGLRMDRISAILEETK